jgi:uncharacterized protein YjbI with pentapeptide repeats
MARSSTRLPRQRAEPDLPASVEALDPVQAEVLLAGEPMEDVLVEAVDLSGRTLDELVATTSILRRVSFAGGAIQSVGVSDVRFSNCDFSNATLRGFEATRVEFIECRLIGMSAAECRWQDVLVDRCDARYAQFHGGRFKNCEFRGTQLTEADFRASDLEGAIFADVVLRGADLSGANLQETDLSHADIEGLILRAEDARGAIITAAQSLDFARLLGVTIK